MVVYQRLNVVMLGGLKGLKPVCFRDDQPFLKTTGNVTQTINKYNAEAIRKPWKHGRTPEAG